MKNYSDEFEFLSIVIPSYNRFDYLLELINSIHKNADVPFELIVNDDNSNDGTKEKTLTSEIYSLTSSIILNNGLSLGLAQSINRAVSICSSEYILMLNADLRIESKFFKDLINVLKVQFIGYLTPMNYLSGGNGFITPEGTKFYIARGIGAGCSIAFRKSIWNAIKGFDNFGCTSGNIDVSFMAKVIRGGFFPAHLHSDRILVSNVSNDKCKGIDSTIALQQHDCSFPKIFGIPEKRLLDENTNRELSERHKNECNEEMQKSYRKGMGLTNIQYWDNYLKITNEEQIVNWKEASCHGQSQWKHVIEKWRLNNK